MTGPTDNKLAWVPGDKTKLEAPVLILDVQQLKQEYEMYWQVGKVWLLTLNSVCQNDHHQWIQDISWLTHVSSSAWRLNHCDNIYLTWSVWMKSNFIMISSLLLMWYQVMLGMWYQAEGSIIVIISTSPGVCEWNRTSSWYHPCSECDTRWC